MDMYYKIQKIIENRTQLKQIEIYTRALKHITNPYSDAQANCNAPDFDAGQVDAVELF